MGMKTRIIFCLALFLVVSPAAWSKGVTVRIDVSGDGLSGPLSVTDPKIVEQFSIWSGPNSRWRSDGGPWNTDYSRIFIDFPGGTVDAPPDGLLRFEVEFIIAGTPTDPPFDTTYNVQYAFDPSIANGYIYLPDHNPFISHGVENNWFNSTQSWEELVRPIIQQALDAQ
jgi:hypothetical protein